MKLVSIVIFQILIQSAFGSVTIKWGSEVSLEIKNFDYVIPITNHVYSLSKKGEENKFSTLSMKKINPMDIKELRKFIYMNTGQKKFDIIDFGNLKSFFYFYGKKNHFFYDVSGKLIQFIKHDQAVKGEIKISQNEK